MATKPSKQEDIEYLKAIEDSYRIEKEKSDLEQALALSLQETDNTLGGNTEENVETNGSSFDVDDDLARAIEISLQETHIQTSSDIEASSYGQHEEANPLKDNHEDEEMTRAIENSLNDLNIHQPNENLEDLERAIINSLNDHAPPLNNQENESDEEDLYQKVFESNVEIHGNPENSTQQTSTITSSKSSFDVVHAYKEQNDIIAACKQSLVESGNYQPSDLNDNDVDLIMNYISNTDNFDNGDQLMEVLHHHYDELSHQKNVDDTTLESNATNSNDNQVVQGSWFQGLLQFSATYLRSTVDSMADFAVGKVFPILEEYDIIDVRFLRNVLNGKFNLNEASKFGFNILRKLILVNKLFNQIKSLNLTNFDVTEIVALVRKLGFTKI